MAEVDKEVMKTQKVLGKMKLTQEVLGKMKLTQEILVIMKTEELICLEQVKHHNLLEHTEVKEQET